MTLYLIAGFALLVMGAEALVRGSSRLARKAGVPPLIVGLTVVAFGTSMPELAVSAVSSLTGRAEISLGNVVGSNIFNVLFILGSSALVAPLVVTERLIRIDVPLMIAVSLGVLVMGLDGRIGRVDGLVLIAGFALYTALLVVRARNPRESGPDGRSATCGSAERRGFARRFLIDILMVIGGLGLLVLGSHLFVAGAAALARLLGLSELVIGLTVVASGTSLPEVATSIIAAFRGERDIAIGNVVGSNIFNILAVLGLSGALASDGIAVPDAALHFDMPVMAAAALACLPVFFTGNVIARWEGAVFLGYYAAYVLYLVLAATGHASLAFFSRTMLWFVLPITLLTLAIVTARALRARNR